MGAGASFAAVIICGALPYAALFVEHQFVLGALWLHDFHDCATHLWLAMSLALAIAAAGSALLAMGGWGAVPFGTRGDDGGVRGVEAAEAAAAKAACSGSVAAAASARRGAAVCAFAYAVYFALYSPVGLAGLVNGADHIGLSVSSACPRYCLCAS